MPTPTSGRLVSEAEALKLLLNGGVIAVPTETFYGLAVDPFCSSGVKELLSRKGRSLDSAVPVVASSSDTVSSWIVDPTEEICHLRIILQNHFWPGPLTLVVKLREDVAREFAPGVLAPDGTLAVRVSSYLPLQRLAGGLSGILTSTSANPKACAPPLTKEDVWGYFPELAVFEPEQSGFKLRTKTRTSKPSTILSLVGPQIVVLREGAVPFDEIERVLWL